MLLMDEPFAALDEQTRTRMWGELLQIWNRSRATVLFVTHSLVEAVYLADEVLVMAARPGRIIERIAVDLPRPRSLDMLGAPALGEMRNRIWHLIAEPQP
jgi:NitT/TauT family transport system ATP-binding protein